MNLKLVESLVQAIESLSSEEQNLLKVRLSHTETPPSSVQPDWQTDPFIGMWSDRTDMNNSTDWVRTLRQQEWST
jgi:hypothetical protein